MKSQVRIIGGNWRGRKLTVVDAEGLRPTPDRIRETLFNWLGTACRGAAVLDCFAGSGVLGFEAMSRGARRLVMIEQRSDVAANLRSQQQRLDAAGVEVIAGDACAVLSGLDDVFDIVFIDPPYARPELRRQVFEILENSGSLGPGAVIYFEWPAAGDFELPSPGLQWRKRKRAGQVNYAIAEWRLSG